MKHFKEAFIQASNDYMVSNESLISSAEVLSNESLESITDRLSMEFDALTKSFTQLDIITSQISYTDSLASKGSISKEALINTCNICNSVGSLVGVSSESLINVKELEDISFTNKAYSISKEGIKEIAVAVKNKIKEIIKTIINWIKKLFGFGKAKEEAVKKEAKQIAMKIEKNEELSKKPVKDTNVMDELFNIPVFKYGYMGLDDVGEYFMYKVTVEKFLAAALTSYSRPEDADNIIKQASSELAEAVKKFAHNNNKYVAIGPTYGYRLDEETKELTKEPLKDTGLDPKKSSLLTIDQLGELITDMGDSQISLDAIKMLQDELERCLKDIDSHNQDMSPEELEKLKTGMATSKQFYNIAQAIVMTCLDLEHTILKHIGKGLDKEEKQDNQ